MEITLGSVTLNYLNLFIMQTKLKNTIEALAVTAMAIGMFILGIVMSVVGIDIIRIMFNFFNF